MNTDTLTYRDYFERWHSSDIDYKQRLEAFEDYLAHRRRFMPRWLADFATSIDDEMNTDVVERFKYVWRGVYESLGEFAQDYIITEHGKPHYSKYINWEYLASDVLPQFFMTNSHNVFDTSQYFDID